MSDLRDLVLVLAPSGRDAALLSSSLHEFGIDAHAVGTMRELAEALAASEVDTAIVAEEALASATIGEFAGCIADQPPWSDLPIIVLTRHGGFSFANQELADTLGNVTTLERPFHPTTLVGTVRAALRSRVRQRAARASFDARDAAEADLRRLNEELERRVEARTQEREVALSQLHEARKLETIGQLTGGVAHDFNNLLTPIMGGLELIMRRLGEDERGLRLAHGAMEAAERARTLVARLLAFGRRQTLQTRAVDLVALVEGMRDLIERSIGPTILVTTDFPADLPAVHVDPHQLELGLLNLAVNARDAMPSGGTLSFSARRRPHPTDPALNDLVRLVVADTGDGMNAATMARAVEPFFTTKAAGAGTGLGLSMVHGLAAQMGGLFRLNSVEGDGTQAELWLPMADSMIVAAKLPGQENAPLAAQGTILLVDDEELVRTSIAESLRGFGFTIVEAPSGPAALARLRAGLTPDILVTDFIMPGMNGATLAREARKQLAHLPVLLITGYSNLRPEDARELDVLSKPFRQADLAAAIMRLADRNTQPTFVAAE